MLWYEFKDTYVAAQGSAGHRSPGLTSTVPSIVNNHGNSEDTPTWRSRIGNGDLFLSLWEGHFFAYDKSCCLFTKVSRFLGNLSWCPIAFALEVFNRYLWSYSCFWLLERFLFYESLSDFDPPHCNSSDSKTFDDLIRDASPLYELGMGSMAWVPSPTLSPSVSFISPRQALPDDVHL